MSKATDEAIAQLQALAGSTGAQTTVQPIGVPGYTAGADGKPVPFEGGGQPVRYYEGSDWIPANAGPVAIAKLQAQLISAGLIPRGAKYSNGVWDDVTRSAFRSVLTYANATGTDANAALNVLQAAPQTKVPTPHLVPDIASVAATVKQTVKAKLGRDATPDEVRHLSQVMMGAEQQSFAAQDQLDVTGGGTAVDPAAQLDLYLEQQYKPEIQRGAAVADLSTQRTNLMGNLFSIDQAIAR